MEARVKWSENVPTRFYCPREQYDAWQSQDQGFPGEWLGDAIVTLGGQAIAVLSGPCCPLYWGNGYAEADKIQSAWEPKDAAAYSKDPVGYGGDRRNWRKANGNYLAYEIPAPYSPVGTRMLTVRWEVSNKAGKTAPSELVCPLGEPTEAIAKVA